MDLLREGITYFILFASLYFMVFFILLMFKFRKQFTEAPEPRRDWTPMISVILPAYNEEEFISGTLDSLMRVEYPKEKLEIIVVDDGSTDRTSDIAGRYADRGVRVVRQENRGKAAALNTGIAQAEGEFIATMDVDSFVEPGILPKLLAYFDSENVAAVTPAIKVKETKTLLNEMQRLEYLTIIFTRRLMSFINTVQVTPGPFSLFRARVLRELGGFDEKNIVEDNEIALRIQERHYEIRSAVNAEVATLVPEKFEDLVKQRIRWHRGGLRNAWTYRKMFKPSYGDLGIYMLPMNIFYFVILFMALFLLLANIFSGKDYMGVLGWDLFWLGFGAISVVGLVTFAMSVIFMYVVINYFDVKRPSVPHLVVYFFFYWYLMAVYNLAVVWKEIKREPMRW
ncbi:MAG: glycosyltransferase [Candidatus Bilamarchaeaceae archaeon]